MSTEQEAAIVTCEACGDPIDMAAPFNVWLYIAQGPPAVWHANCWPRPDAILMPLDAWCALHERTLP